MRGPTNRSNRARLGRIVLVMVMLPAIAIAGSAAAKFGDAPDNSASRAGPWTKLPGVASAARSARAQPSYIHPEKYQALALDQAALQDQLASAPLESVSGESVAGGSTSGEPATGARSAAGSAGGAADGVVLSLPSPTGGFADFRVVESPIMEPGLAAKFPDIHTYLGQGIDDRAATLRFDVSDQGFHAQVLSPDGAWYIDPYYHLSTSVYISYFKRDLTSSPHGDFTEGAIAAGTAALRLADAAGAAPVALAAKQSGTQLRTYRAAFAADGEYTAFFGGTVPAAQAAIVTALNRVNGIYEVEVAIRMVLIANNNLLAYTDATTDPYTNTDTTADINANQTNIDTVIGDANYDVGHVFTTGSGGRAGLGVGTTGQKARGTTGIASPVGDPFTVDYVAHEVGHQFGGDHTFNGVLSNCAGNRNASTAYEPGSGSTLQAYAGICGLDDLQRVGTGATGASDPYFHSASFNGIVAYTTGGNPGDLGATATGNSVPTANAGGDGTIPASTPFLLQGAGTDADPDALTYDWEQRDLGQARALSNPEITAGPLFRSFVPTTSPIRYLPKLSEIVAANTNVPGPCPALTGSIGAAQRCWSELIPTVARALNFRVTVRDNRAGGGGVNTDDTVVNVANTGAPFTVTSQSAPVTYGRGSAQNVTWNVAGTDSAPINAPNVNILLSTDGGATFPTTLATDTPNDGSQGVTIPNVTTATARIMVVQSGSGVGVRFFNINAANFAIARAATITTLTSAPNPSVYGQPVTFTATVAPAQPNVNVPGGTVQFLDGATVLGQANLAGNPAQATLNTAVLGAGTHSITAVYVDDANFTGSTSAVLTQVVEKAHVSVIVTSSANPSDFGSPVTFTATIVPVPPGAGTPTGTVQFSVDSVALGAPATLAGAVANSPSTASLLPGSHTVLAQYSGDANFFDGSGGLQQVVTCKKTITGTVTGSPLVGPGSVCIVDANISGSVAARPDSAVFVSRSKITGSIAVNKAFAFAMCASNVGGSTLITRTDGFVLIGNGGDDGSFACPGNTVGATLSIIRTTGSAEAGANTVGGSMTLNDTASTGAPPEGVPELEANRIHGDLGCLRNVPAPINDGQPNPVGGVRSGQCKLL